MQHDARIGSDSIFVSAVCIDQSVFRILSQHNGAMQGFVSLCEPSLTHEKVVTNPKMGIYGLTYILFNIIYILVCPHWSGITTTQHELTTSQIIHI